MDPRDLILYPNNLWMYLYYFGFPSYGVTVLSIAYFGHSNHFRAALIHLMKADISYMSHFHNYGKKYSRRGPLSFIIIKKNAFTEFSQHKTAYGSLEAAQSPSRIPRL